MLSVMQEKAQVFYISCKRPDGLAKQASICVAGHSSRFVVFQLAGVRHGFDHKSCTFGFRYMSRVRYALRRHPQNRCTRQPAKTRA